MAMALAGIVGLAGCAGEAGSGPALSLRPAELRLDGIDPCALLAAAQVRQLETRGGRCTEQQADEPGGAGCRWPNPQGERP